MASLTIRKLDDTLKTYLRLRSAQNGRSLEEEVRVILRGLIEPADPSDLPAASPAPAALPEPIAPQPGQAREPRVTLIIGGGIAAYKSLDLIRRLRERHIRVRCVLTKAATEFVTELAASALSGDRVFTDLFDARSEFEVFQRFAELTAGKMALFISHRFSTVRMADRIVVLANGKIAEEGSHDQLASLGGRYKEMFELQAASYR